MDKIIVGGIEYQVELVDIQDEHDVSEIDLTKNLISVDKDLPVNQRHAAILHEVLHAMNWKFEEEKVEFMAQALYHFIRSNKEFIQDIIK